MIFVDKHENDARNAIAKVMITGRTEADRDKWRENVWEMNVKFGSLGK